MLVAANALKKRSYFSLLSLVQLIAEKSNKKYRDKFKIDYDYFSNIQPGSRVDQLQRIIAQPKSSLQFLKNIPFFPILEVWDYFGVRLMMHIWEPPQGVKPRALLVFLHSLNGHTSMCGEMAQNLAKNGIIVAGFDFQNFGQSQGSNRGKLQSFDNLVEVSQQFVIKMKNKYPNLKVFLGGMSLGGAISFHISIRSPKLTNGIIMLSPSIRENNRHYPLLKKLTLLLSFALPNQQLLAASSRNGSKYKLNQYCKKDPYIYQGRLWAKTVQQILIAMSKTKRMYSKLLSPYLVVQSGTDKLVDPFACLDLERLSPSQDKTTVIIHGMWHAVWFDDHVYDVIRIIQEWLDQRI